MNDESLTSDDLFKSGSTNGFSDFTGGRTDHQNGNLAGYITEQRLHLLGERIQEDNETQVKEFNDPIESLTEALDSLTLSTDGDEYADIHMQNGFPDKIETDAAGTQDLSASEDGQRYANNRPANKDCITVLESNLKQPDLPISNLTFNGQIRRKEGSHIPKQEISLGNRISGIPEQVSHLRGSNTRLASQNVVNCGDTVGQEPTCILELGLNLPCNMADSAQSPQFAPFENGAGARLKVRDTGHKPKTNKHVKNVNSNSDQFPKPPFKLQQKKYENDIEDSQVNTNRTEAEVNENEQNLTFPVEYLSPYSNPKTQKTIKPGGRNSPTSSLGSVQVNDNMPSLRSQAFRPKVSGKSSDGILAVRGMRNNNSDPLIHNTERLVTNRNSADVVTLAVDVEATHQNDRDQAQTIRAEATSSVDVDVLTKQDNKTKPKQVVRPKSRNVLNVTTTKDNDERSVETKPDAKSVETRAKDNVNMDLWRARHGSQSNSPQAIEYINNLDTDTYTTKKIENKDMKNTNRIKNTERNPNISLVNTDCSTISNVDSVEDQYQNPVIDLGLVSRHNAPNSNTFVDRLNTNSNSNAETSPIIVPYGIEPNPVSVMTGFDESLSSNILFGNGTEDSDLMFARMLQEKYDKEHEEMRQRNQFDIAPETLRLHNLTPNLNVADGESEDPSLFGNDSLLNDQNDVYETSPRSFESDHDHHRVDHQSLEIDSVELHPNSMNQDSMLEVENYHDVDQFYPELTPIGQEYDYSNEDQLEQQEIDDNISDAACTPYTTENLREVLPPESPDESAIYVRAERGGPPVRSDEDFARSLQRQLMMEEEQLDQELARQIEEEEEEERERGNDYRSQIRSGARPMGLPQPLHSRVSMWNSRPLHVRQEPSRYAEDRRIQNTWDRPLRQANVYGGRQRYGRQNREGEI